MSGINRADPAAARRAAQDAARRSAEEAARKAAAAKAAAAETARQQRVETDKATHAPASEGRVDGAATRERINATDSSARKAMDQRAAAVGPTNLPSLDNILRSAGEPARVDQAVKRAEEQRTAAAQAQRDSEAARADYEKVRAAGGDPARIAEARQRSDWAAVGALAQMQKSLEAQKDANAVARDGGQPLPFPAAERPRDIFSVGRADAATQREVLGTDAYTTPEQRQDAVRRESDELRAQSPQKPVAEWSAQETADHGRRMNDWIRAHKDHPADVAQFLDRNGDVLVQLNRQSAGSVAADGRGKAEAAGILREMGGLVRGTEADASLRMAEKVSKAPLTSAEQAAEASKRLDAMEPRKPVDQWGPQEAAMYSENLKKELEAHQGDPAYQNTLLNAQRERLGATTRIFGQAYSSEDDATRRATEATAHNLGRISEVIPQDSGRRIAWDVAKNIGTRDQNDLNGVESGLTHYEERGGSTTFRGMLSGALEAQDKRVAASAAAGTPQFLAEVQGRASGAWDALKDKASSLEFPAPVANALDQFNQRAHEFKTDTIREVLHPGEDIRALQKEGDSYTLSAGVGGSFVVSGSAEAKVTVERDDKGNYVVSAEGKGDLGIGFAKIGDAKAGMGGKVSFSFRTPEDAERAAVTLMAAGFNPPTQPPPADARLLQDNIKSLEFSTTGSVGASVPTQKLFGQVAGASANVEGAATYRVEFEGGKPSKLVMARSLEGKAEGGGGLGIGAIQSLAGDQPELAKAVQSGGKVSGKAVVETTIPLEGAPDLGAVLKDPGRYAKQQKMTHELSVEWQTQVGDSGARGTNKVKVTNEQVAGVLDRAGKGDLGNLFNGIEFKGWDVRHFDELSHVAEVNVVVASGKAGEVRRTYREDAAA